MRIEFPESLPVSGRRSELMAALADHPVLIVSGATGSGKTTQLPKLCLAAGRGQAGLIGHTQPRRLAATSVARRIAHELGTPLGTDVGFKVRFNESVAKTARIKLMTDGILLAETLSDPLLKRYDTLLIDEAHERSLNIDFLLGYLKQLIDGPRRHDLKLIITSATIDAARFAAHFGAPGHPAPVIEVAGRTYPVEVRWRPLGESFVATVEGKTEDAEPDLAEAVEYAIDELWQGGLGDVLVFLPGEREIRSVHDHLRRAWARRTGAGWLGSVTVLPLYARLAAHEQQRIFQSGRGLRVVLATNVAETSLTVPGIRYVVDSGLARVKRYRYRGKVDQLQIEPISQAAAQQRAGRCGRVSAGVCIRLYSELEFQRRPAFTDPEIMRVSLAGVILRMKALKLSGIEHFPFLDVPSKRAIQDGYELLFELDALDAQHNLTPIGHQLARWPLDPRVGRMILAARERGCLREVLVIAAALSVQDPRERPLDRQQAADQAHARWIDPRSDFLSWLKLWDGCVESANQGEAPVSRRTRAARLAQSFLSAHKLQEWVEVHAQLQQVVVDLGWPVSSRPDDYESVHRALLAGLLGNLGVRAPEESWYEGTHATRFWLHPGSGVGRRGAAAAGTDRTVQAEPSGGRGAPRWLMVAEMVDTGKLYGRTVARIDPAWVEHAARHLIRRSWSEPHWEKRAGQAMAFERGVVYGLTVYAQRRVPYAGIDPRRARELLIREGLVAGHWESRCPFWAHNRRVIAQVQEIEAKMRRPDLLVDEAFLFDWFDALIPEDVVRGVDLERWWQGASQQQPELLFLRPEQLLRQDTQGIDHQRFPRQIVMRGVAFALSYQFDPGSEQDGVTLEVPLYALNQVDAVRAEWLVPGMLQDKVLALLKSLPPKVRRLLQPIDAWAQQCLTRRSEADWARPLVEVLIQDLREYQGVRVTAADFRLESAPVHAFMNFRVRDEHGRVLGASRQLAALRAQWGGQAQGSFQAALQRVGLPQSIASTSMSEPPPAAPAKGASPSESLPPIGERITEWSFGVLPELLEVPGVGGQGAETLVGFPALVDRGDAVSIELFDDPERAQREHRVGVRRLCALALRDALRAVERQVPQLRQFEMAYLPYGAGASLTQDWVAAVLERTCLEAPWPTDRTSFLARMAAARPRLSLIGQELGRMVALILSEEAALRKKWPLAKGFPDVLADLEQQRAALLPPGFLLETPPAVLGHMPRYLKAMIARIDRLRSDPARDAAHMADIRRLWQRWHRAQASLKGRVEPWLMEYRWLLEELRVSLFAQELRTPTPVSVKRLDKMWDSLSRGSY